MTPRPERKRKRRPELRCCRLVSDLQGILFGIHTFFNLYLFYFL
jgi:hypothetical protein